MGNALPRGVYGTMAWTALVASSYLCVTAAEPAKPPVLKFNIPPLATPTPGRPDPNCPHCRGIGLVPLTKPLPYIHIEGQATPKPESAVRGEFCPQCRKDADPAVLVEIERRRLETATALHEEWEKRCNKKFIKIETRFATLHSLAPASESRKMAAGLENLAVHLHELTGSLELTSTTPAKYNLFVLWEKPAYLEFCKAMEQAYGVESLGVHWTDTPELAGYDHHTTPFFYESPATMETRPPVHGVLFLFGHRQIDLVCGYRAPPWLAEGFASYCEYAVLKKNRWYTIYDPARQFAQGDWMFDLRLLNSKRELRPWKDVLHRELREFTSIEYTQAFGMVSFLLRTQPRKFLQLTRLLREGRDIDAALEAAYSTKLPELEAACNRWIAAGKW